MNFKEKMRCAYYKIKTRMIVAAFLVLTIIIFAVAPLSIGIVEATKPPKKEETTIVKKEKEDNQEEYYEENEEENLDENNEYIEDELDENNEDVEEDTNEENGDIEAVANGNDLSHVDLSPGFDWYKLLTALGKYLPTPHKSIPLCFTKEYFSTFFKGVRISLYVYIIIVGIGFYKAIPKHEYDDVEHGSSKWAEGGEQYAILSKKKGIILAEKNYLPVDKRGNVNVLVVRRFWCW